MQKLLKQLSEMATSGASSILFDAEILSHLSMGGDKPLFADYDIVFKM